MIDVVTMSSKGQIVIPRDIREAMKLKQQDKFIVTYEDDGIFLKKVNKIESQKKIMKLLDEISEKFREAGITYEDVEREIKNHRAEKYKS